MASGDSDTWYWTTAASTTTSYAIIYDEATSYALNILDNAIRPRKPQRKKLFEVKCGE